MYLVRISDSSQYNLAFDVCCLNDKLSCNQFINIMSKHTSTYVTIVKPLIHSFVTTTELNLDLTFNMFLQVYDGKRCLLKYTNNHNAKVFKDYSEKDATII